AVRSEEAFRAARLVYLHFVYQRSWDNVHLLNHYDNSATQCMIYPHCPIQVSTSSASSLLRIVFDQITEGQLEFVELDQHFDTIQIGEGEDKREYTILSGKTELEAHLKNQFPDADPPVAGSVLAEVWHHKPLLLHLYPLWYWSYRPGTLTTNKDLHVIFSYLFYGTCVRINALLLQHYKRGAYYPKGGGSEISYHIIPVIQKSGDNVLVRAPVTQILVNNDGAAYGVKVRKGQEEVEVHPPTQTKPDIQERLDMMKHGRGSLLVFSGFDGTQEELGIVSTNFWLFKKNYMDVKRMHLISVFTSLCHKYAADVSDVYHVTFPGKSCMTMLTMVKYEWFEEWTDTSVRKRGDDYTNYKMKFGKVGVPGRCDPPLTNMHYLGAHCGAMYSAEHNLGASMLRLWPGTLACLQAIFALPYMVCVDVRFPGQDVFSCGIAGALHGGLLCASTVLDHIVYINLLFLKKKQKDGQAG
uniref:Si:ch1073-13h15.3 n=1 Tax=Oncorhynchus tshawytscha TaxID=74940 RepID=A0AAZ3PHF4_ONCTS